MLHARGALPRVVIASASKFWTYHMARGAQRAGMLHKLVLTIHDKQETGVPLDKIVRIPWPAYAAWLTYHLPIPDRQAWSYYIGDNLFDYAACRHARDADIYHVYNHHGLHSMRAASKAGAITVVERASAHPNMQHGILRDEFARFGLNYPRVSEAIISKHLQEYDEADWIVVCSDFVYRTMVEAGVPAHKLVVITFGFDPSRFYPGEQDDGVFRVIFAGALSLQKGLQYLLEGYKLADLPPDRSELVIVGEPFPDAASFLPRYEGLYRHLRFVPNQKLGDIFRTGSVFALPSLQDGYAMVVVEAAACGLPVIISRNVGTIMRDGQDGFIVPIRDAQAIAEKLRYLFHHAEERRRMGQSAYEYIRHYTWDHYQNNLVNFYQRIWTQQLDSTRHPGNES